jgi:hypothetical protein
MFRLSIIKGRPVDAEIWPIPQNAALGFSTYIERGNVDTYVSDAGLICEEINALLPRSQIDLPICFAGQVSDIGKVVYKAGAE